LLYTLKLRVKLGHCEPGLCLSAEDQHLQQKSQGSHQGQSWSLSPFSIYIIYVFNICLQIYIFIFDIYFYIKIYNVYKYVKYIIYTIHYILYIFIFNIFFLFIYLIYAYKYLQGWCQEDGARLFSVVPSGQDKGQWAQTEAEEAPAEHEEELLPSEGDGALAQAAQGGYGVSFSGDIPAPPGRGAVQPALGDPAWAGGWAG